jgi:hypothetical protein
VELEPLPSPEQLRQRPQADAPGPLSAVATNVGASSLQNDALVWYPVQPTEGIAIMWAYEQDA